MTGFGDASSQVDGVHYSVEVRSLNNKYFKSVIRLPEEIQGLEAEFESRLRERISRGTVTLTARCSDDSSAAAHHVNEQALTSYIQQLRRIPQIASGEARLDVAALLTLPGVLHAPADDGSRYDKARAALLPLLDKACDALLTMRDREGTSLAADLKSHLSFIGERLAQVQRLAPGVVAEYERRLKERIEALLNGAEVRIEQGDLIREIAVYAERTDIAEEIKRLSVHLDQFEELIRRDDGKPVGRTLDFLAQEMLREANTIASKSPDAAISRHIVEIKGAIDRIKEQAQNAE